MTGFRDSGRLRVEHVVADKHTPAEVKELLESTLESVDHAEEVVMRAAREMGFDDDQQHEIGISLRECMVNAVVHGNRYNSKKKVHFSVTHTADRLEIVIGDEGEGFVSSTLPLRMLSLARHLSTPAQYTWTQTSCGAAPTNASLQKPMSASAFAA